MNEFAKYSSCKDFVTPFTHLVKKYCFNLPITNGSGINKNWMELHVDASLSFCIYLKATKIQLQLKQTNKQMAIRFEILPDKNIMFITNDLYNSVFLIKLSTSPSRNLFTTKPLSLCTFRLAFFFQKHNICDTGMAVVPLNLTDRDHYRPILLIDQFLCV
ncbi:hypothetical protein KUTeg_011350 [Tegillarca granosa]|uniref:Uncharacterized protein n=1 Tax=Tegillarca granosa TaxID=220873 RepID=A0ABQ9F6C3_TEGGR|nr:hypothetical protein KUTeg_011350 [Tegillarca granosa]